jgi:MerR family transcriptional regulator, mercuric resistance operon regulatory protein
MNTDLRMSIGALSEQTAVGIETIRFYERLGLLPAPPRSAAGHRLYATEHKRRLIFIRRARDLGFSLKEVRALLGPGRGRHVTCAKVKTMTEQHIADLRRRINDLKRMDRALSRMVVQCAGGETGACAIIDALASGARS